MADNKIDAQKNIDNPDSPMNQFKDQLTGVGTFKDSGRQSEGLGESLDSVTGVPVRTAIDQMQKGNFNLEGARATINSIGNDPRNAPSGVDIAQNMGITNPYAGAAMATLVDVGAQVPLPSGASGAVVKEVKALTPEAKAILSQITTPEAAAALKGAERAKYLAALDEAYGPAAARAKAMGFGADTYYHGTNAADIVNFEPSKKGIMGPGVYSSKSANKASQYGDIVYPLKLNEADVKSVGAGDVNQTLVKDPKNIRSTSAAFDPRFKDSTHLLAAKTAVGDSKANRIAAASSQSFSDKAPNHTDLPKMVEEARAAANQLSETLGYANPKAQAATGRYNTLRELLERGAKGYAEGGVVDGGFDPDAFLASQSAAAPTMGGDEELGGFNPDEFIEEQLQDKYGGLGQQAIAGLEGVARGVAGPLAPLAERALGVDPEDIRGREEANPWTHGIGEGVGLVGGAVALPQASLAGAMAKAGEAAKVATGLAEAANAASWGTKVGAAAVAQAAEMAVFQGSDEAAKLILQDPSVSAESAIANIGLAAALGGAGGAFFAGAVNPLWEATAGPQVERLLTGLKDHLNGKAKIILPGETEQALSSLGVQVAPEIRAGISGDAKAVEQFTRLKEVQHKQIIEGIDKLRTDVTDSVAKALRIDPSDVSVYSENEAGHELLNAFKKEYDIKYGPVAEKLAKRDAEAAIIAIKDEARMQQYGQMLEKGMAETSVHSPYYKEWETYANRLLDAENIGAMDKIKTEINNRMRTPMLDGQTKITLGEIKAAIAGFQEAQIEREAALAGAKALSKDLLEERALANRSYAEFAKMSDDLTNHLGIGDFRGAGGLKNKLTDKIAAEDLLKKFSIRGNADFIPFLQQHFPETLQLVKEHELKRLLKPAVLSSKGEMPINVNKLSDIVAKGMAGQKEYINAILPPGALEKIEAAKTILNAIPNPKSSGTAGWLSKVMDKMPQSALAGIGMLTGHNPVSSYLVGEVVQRLGKNAPEAARLAYLRFLATDQPVSGKGFKAAVEFIHAVQKGESVLNKAAQNVLKPGVEVLTPKQWPTPKSIEKLDKMVADAQDKPAAIADRQGDSGVGTYLPDHQVSLTQSATAAVEYLKTLKPHPQKLSPLGAEVPPTPEQEARYKRALEIAQQPAVVLSHMKDGTMQLSDLKDLQAMYPGVYQRMAQKLSNTMIDRKADDAPIPYKTRMGLSLFLGQPLDATMDPMSIISAQPKPIQPNPQPPQSGGNRPAKLGKTVKSYQTPLQAAESDRSGRD